MNIKMPPLFIADCHFGKLAKYLRVMGFDTLFFNNIDDNDLIKMATEDGRIILTRDRLLHEREKAPTFYIYATDTLEQLQTLQKKYCIKDYSLCSRCIICNTPLQSIAKTELHNRVPKKVKEYFVEFETCVTCNRIYWHGDHYKHMMLIIDAI